MIRTRFCPKCGKPYDGLGICAACYLAQKKLIKAPSLIEIKICPKCNAIYRMGKWREMSSRKAIEEAVKEELKIDSEARNPQIEIYPERIDSYNWKADVRITADLKDKRVTDLINITVRVKRDVCERCSRIAAGYYSAIIQIRGEGRIPTKEELARARGIAFEAIQKLQQNGDEMAFISDEKEVAEGLDIYIGTLAAGKQISKAIIEQMGGKLSQSPKLMGRRDGKEVYRITYSIRLPEFLKGDIVAIGGDVVEVKKIDKKINGIDLRTGARYCKKIDELKNVVKIGSIADKKKTVLTAASETEIQILDPDTFSPVYLSRPKFLKAINGTEISIVKTSMGIFVLPD
ncbi:MAG: 60S ribosomal export protein NMD3 [Methanocellales archaeon]